MNLKQKIVKNILNYFKIIYQQFQVGIKIVNSNDGDRMNVRFVHWLSALVKKLNNKRKPPPGWKPQSAKKKKS